MRERQRARVKVWQVCGTGVLAGMLTIAGCHKADTNGMDPNDPAAANLAPINGATNDSVAVAGAAQYPSGQASAGQTGSVGGYRSAQGQGSAMPPPPPEDTGNSGSSNYAANGAGAGDQGYANQGAYASNTPGYDESGYGDPGYTDTSYDQPVYAEQPPPELPAYEQPPCPGDNYMWTPGYWNYTQTGYFWVPGVWVVAPFIGALWTSAFMAEWCMEMATLAMGMKAVIGTATSFITIAT
jgi:hypothetical protein